MTDWRRLAAETLMVGIPGAAPDGAVLEWLQTRRPSGVILFGRNLQSPASTVELIDAVRSLVAPPGWIALDQEGGRVSRLEPWVGRTLSAMELARAGVESVKRFGEVTGQALRALGFNLDFAPVVDLCTPEASNGIGDRSFGTDPGVVTRMAGAFLEALQGTGVAGCLKHFPGLGDTTVDSHRELPTAGRAWEVLEREDLFPFRELGGTAACVMVGHAHYPALDPEGPLPASCSPNVVSRLLRGRLGNSGLIVSDDLEMGAVTEWDRDGAAAVEALRAGCDLLLYCSDLKRADLALDAIARAAADDEDFAAGLRGRAAHCRAVAERWPPPRADLSAWERIRPAFARFGQRP